MPEVMGRLDHLVDAVYERFKDRYFPDERTQQHSPLLSRMVDGYHISRCHCGCFRRKVRFYFPTTHPTSSNVLHRYFAKVIHVFPPRTGLDPTATNGTSTSSPQALHAIGGDLKIPLKEATERDDPTKYYYQIQIIDEERSSDNKLSVKDREAREANRAKWSASLMEVKCGQLRCATCFIIEFYRWLTS
jgi:bromodomain adjacent to zinc finger domain protein 1A